MTGGWYDAGDHGKYVINAGISVWTLLNWWERTKDFGTSAGDFADGKMNIPENANSVPDLLDEARWELEFELKMQVPEGNKLAGMVHHKIHDGNWTQLGLAPHEDPMVRFLQPPSTAATLNLAANAAQAARVWSTIDKAVLAEVPGGRGARLGGGGANPEVYPPKGGVGGGAYDDDNVDDDFYWAAASSTSRPARRCTRSRSPSRRTSRRSRPRGPARGHAHVDDLGGHAGAGLDLAGNRAQRNWQRPTVEAIRKNIVAARRPVPGDGDEAGLPRAVRGPTQKGYPWGSTSFVLTNALMMGLAYDFTHEAGT